MPNKQYQENLTPKDWVDVFILQTIERNYILFAPTFTEKNLWIAGFKYVVASTNTI